jgi:hypothetical protein
MSRMCADTGSLEFAHARIWARWGMRLDDVAWRRIETTRELAPVLELARASALTRWLQGVTAEAGLHAVESALRRRWRECVRELARWMPAEWRASIDWCARLADLPAVQHWAREPARAAWLEHDEHLRALDGAAGDAAARAPDVDPAWRDLLGRARGDPASVLASWLQTWRRRLPLHGQAAIERELLPLLVRHVQAFAAPQAADGWGQRRALHARLVALLRRHPVEPLSAFVFLALQALELERLRSEIVGRMAFPQRTLHS